MKYVIGQFICLPRVFDLKSPLKYTDLIVYIAIRSFNNKDNNCFPSYETIAEKAGCGRSYTIQAIKRLESSGLIEVIRSAKIKVVNRYKFVKCYDFERIPYQIFEEDLTLNEKSMLLWLRQWVRMPNLIIPYKIKKLSKLLKISYKIVHQQVSALIKKGYIKKYYHEQKQFGICLTDKISWTSDYVVKPRTEPVKIMLC